MTPEAMHAALLAELTEAFSRPHPDPAAEAQAFLARMTRDGWRPIAALADRPSPARTAPRPVAEEALRRMREDIAAARRRREEREAAEARAARCRCGHARADHVDPDYGLGPCDSAAARVGGCPCVSYATAPGGAA